MGDVRARLIEAAADVFAEKGYEGAGVQEIARRAGLTTGAIYSRFSGKADLLAATIEARRRLYLTGQPAGLASGWLSAQWGSVTASRHRTS